MIEGSNLRGIGIAARIACWVVLATSLVSAIGTAIWLVSYYNQADMIWLMGVTGIARVLQILAFLVSIVLVLAWMFLAHRNLWRAGLTGLRHRPTWVVASYFVPIVNLLIPFTAMRELHNRSHGEGEDLAESSVEDVTSWWACHLGAVAPFLVVFATEAVNFLPGLMMTTPFWANYLLTIMSAALLAAAAFFLQRIIRDVTEAQREGGDLSTTFA